MLGTGANVVVYPGGLDEANDDTASSAIAIRTRKGFVRLAVKHGVDVLPMFCFGELEAVSAVAGHEHRLEMQRLRHCVALRRMLSAQRVSRLLVRWRRARREHELIRRSR